MYTMKFKEAMKYVMQEVPMANREMVRMELQYQLDAYGKIYDYEVEDYVARLKEGEGDGYPASYRRPAAMVYLHGRVEEELSEAYRKWEADVMAEFVERNGRVPRSMVEIDELATVVAGRIRQRLNSV